MSGNVLAALVVVGGEPSMKTANFKFLVLAVLCVLSVFPILGYVQRQAALRPDLRPDFDTQRERARSQRLALHDWLEHSFAIAAVTTAPGDPHIVNVALRPEVTHVQALAMAGRVQQVMTAYFHEGKSGAVTVVTLQRDRGHDQISVVTGLPERGPAQINSWHIFSGHTQIQ
jgi:hypothetical protein